MKLFSSRRRVLTAAAVLLLALFLARPGVSSLKIRITNSISRALARPVEIGSVHLRFLPRPGFDLENVVVYEDPAFGAEPMLRAPQVSAAVRLTSLLRGRLDISRMELTEPSLNLVRRQDGRWNWESLLERSARTPLAPTAKSKREPRAGFPYIAASSGRINFKSGPEKKPYALLNADFSLWQESENAWGVRLQAEPLRTDVSLSDTGLLRMNGTWQRAGSLRETPLQFSLEWERAQLGQLTKLVSGNDKGWRGELLLDATLNGTPAALQVAADAAVQDFHRYDIPSSEALRLAGHCEAQYSSIAGAFSAVLCTAPVNAGMITVRGTAGLPGMHTLDLSLNLDGVPVSAVAELARHAKKSLPADLVSTGNVQGTFTAHEDGASTGAQFAGKGEITHLHVQSAVTKVEFATGTISFELKSNRISPFSPLKSNSLPTFDSSAANVSNGIQIVYGPFSVGLGGPIAGTAEGWFGQSGYGLALRGDGEISRIIRLADLLGLPAIHASIDGEARLDLHIAGSWLGNVAANSSGFSLPQVMGSVQLHNAEAIVRGLNGPVEISSAQLSLLPDGVRIDKLSFHAADAQWTGSIALPRGCGTPQACTARFNLNTADVGLGDVSRWLSPRANHRPWYQLIPQPASGTTPFLQRVRASGKISAGRMRINNVAAGKVSATLDLEGGKLKISDLRSNLFGGMQRGNWQADFTGDEPVYAGSGTFAGIALDEMAEAMGDSWISGTASGIYQISGSGSESPAFWKSAEGGLQFDLRDGKLPHLSLSEEPGPLRITRWQGNANLSGGNIEIEKGSLFTPTSAYEISGAASLGRTLNLTLTRNTDAAKSQIAPVVYNITGTLSEPHIAITPTPQTQAQLKP